MELVATRIADGRVEVTLTDGFGLTRLEGTRAQIAGLCAAMEQVAVLAAAGERPEWLTELRVGEALVRLGVAGGRVRLVLGPARP